MLIGTNEIGRAWREVISFCHTPLEVENMVNTRGSEMVCGGSCLPSGYILRVHNQDAQVDYSRRVYRLRPVRQAV
jgi:hypothetical protein